MLVRAEAIGVGKPDVLFRTGVYRWMPALPAVPGAEMAVRIADAALSLLTSRAVTPAIHAVLPLADGRRAHEMLEAREVLGKLVLKP